MTILSPIINCGNLNLVVLSPLHGQVLSRSRGKQMQEVRDKD